MDIQYQPEWNEYLAQFRFIKESDMVLPVNTKKFAVIVETRCHLNLTLVVRNFMYLLKDNKWGLIFFHGTKNRDYVKFPGTIYIPLEKENLTIDEYNILFTSTKFWDTLLKLGCENAFIFQMDTLLFKKDIEKYTKYDYIGSPWIYKQYGLDIGNGGLSMRNVKKMHDITTMVKRYDGIPCDIYFCTVLEMLRRINYPTVFPDVPTAQTFSVESLYYPDPCGMHKPALHLFPNRESYTKILSKRHILNEKMDNIFKNWDEYIKTNLNPLITSELEGNIYNNNCPYMRIKANNIAALVAHLNPKDILEIGFNAGFSSVLMQMVNEDSNITAIDINSHSYVVPCYNRIKQDYNIKLITMESKKGLVELITKAKEYDIIHIDGSNDPDVISLDLRVCISLSHKNTVIIANNTEHQHINDVYNSFVKESIIKEYTWESLLPCIKYEHRFFTLC